MFSVIIPLYNKEDYIASTLNSVLNQSFKDFEVIIVNDGSTDESVEVVKKFDDSRIRLVEQVNQGVSITRNRGIKEARFDWIAFLDADDRWDVTFLEEIKQAISKYPNNSIFATNINVIRNTHVCSSHRVDFIPHGEVIGEVNIFKSLGKYGTRPINSSNSVIKKKHLEKHGLFPEGRRNLEDHDLWIRLCVNEPIVYINKKLSFIIDDDENSASIGVFLSKDFISLIQTFKQVKNRLLPAEKLYFKKHYNRFIVISFLSYKENYTKTEIRKLKKEANKILRFPYNFYINVLVFFNVKYEHVVKIGRFIKRCFGLK